jgi:hypothetical protein
VITPPLFAKSKAPKKDDGAADHGGVALGSIDPLVGDGVDLDLDTAGDVRELDHFMGRGRRKKWWITCEWCGERKQTADVKTRYCCDLHRNYAYRDKKATARAVAN